MDALPILVLVLFASLVVAGILYGIYAAKKRRQEMADLAARLGLTFDPERDHDLAAQFEFLNKLRQGDNRYAYNVLRGDYCGHPVLVFDYHYETHSTDSKGHRQTSHHHFSFFMLFLPRQVPELTIVREGLFSKIAQAFGYDDIDFESAEFSRKFCVRSKDRRFAYDVCHGRFMEYLLANDDLALEFEHNVLALGFDRQLAVADLERNLNRLLAVRELLPAYLFNPV